MMSVKHDEIDLNAEAVPGDRDNEELRPVIGVSVAETLTESDNGRIQGSEVGKVRACDSAKVICDLNIVGNGEESDDSMIGEENDVNMYSVSVDREVDVIGKVGNPEEGSESLDRGVDTKDKENNGKCGDGVSRRDEIEVEGAGVAERLSCEAEMDCNANVGPVGEVLELGINDRNKFQLLDQKLEEATCDGLETQAVEIDTQTQLQALEPGSDDRDQVQLSRQKLEEGTSDGPENQAMEIDTQSQQEALEQGTDDRENPQSWHQKFKEATSDGFDNQPVEVDIKTQLEANDDQLMYVHASKARDSSNSLKKSYVVNLVVDLDPYVTKVDTSRDMNAKLVSSQLEFCEGDLVWGKVRSHPWWPGQIFGPSAASKKANKYFKKDSYLIAYFGDQTFAWNEASKLKSFREHFAQMEKQTSLEDFHYAVDCALEEVSRRVEFGLACSCIHKESYEMIKSQITVNAGIGKESSRRDGGDSYSNAAHFEPVKLSEHINSLAQLPYNGDINRLEFVTIKAQLSAFYRWKGYLQLPEFHVLGGLLESDADIPLLGEVKHGLEGSRSAASDSNGDKQDSSSMGKLKIQDGSSHERKHTNGDSIHPRRKEKSLIDLLAERHVNMSNDKQGTDGTGDELISSSSVKKRKTIDSISDDRAVKHKKLDSISDDMSVKHKKSGILAVKNEKSDLSVDTANKCLPIKRTFGVGNSILKVASQLNGSSPILKSGDGTFQKTVFKNKSKEKSQGKKQFPSEEISPAALLSQLNLTARDPMERCNFLISLVSFFSEFRNLVSLEQPQEEVTVEKTAKTWTNLETTETSEAEPMKDTYWTDRIIQSNSEEEQAIENKNVPGEVLHEAPSEKEIAPVEPTSAVQLSTLLESGLQTAGDNMEQKAVQPVDPLDGFSSDDLSPTALILNFTDLESVPSKEDLNKIFSRYGPLNELETEVLKSKRAKVVFKRRSDAETAFSSAGKYSIFGPSLVSYCLKYMRSTPSRSSSRATKRGRKAASDGENAT